MLSAYAPENDQCRAEGDALKRLEYLPSALGGD